MKTPDILPVALHHVQEFVDCDILSNDDVRVVNLELQSEKADTVIFLSWVKEDDRSRTPFAF